MPDRESPDDFTGFRAGFLAEAEEYVQVLEHNVIELENGLSQGIAAPQLLQEMFRASHTLKALAAMLEFEPIVDLCHHVEGIIRSIEHRLLPFNSVAVDLLIDGTSALASMVHDVEEERPVQSPENLLTRLDSLLALADSQADPVPAPQPATSVQREDEQAAKGKDDGRRVLELVFHPTPELAARGITINAVREAVGRLGEMVKVTPDVTSDGGIQFRILLLTAEPPAVVAAAAGIGPEAVHQIDESLPGNSAKPSLVDSTPRSNVVRVEIGRLDDLMRLVGELVGSRARMVRALKRLEQDPGAETIFSLYEATQRMDRQIKELRESVMRARIVQIREAFGRMPLVARDAARAAEKRVHLELSGEETEVDKMIVDRLTDPLIHLVRNAIDHGIEPPSTRRARGKPEMGTVRLSARRDGDRVVVEIADDGQGIDREKVAARAAAIGFDAREIAESDDALLQALCHPGLSTRDQAGRTSGRGIGMDVVRQRMRELNGALELHSRPDSGTTFTLRLPLTLAIVEVLTTSCGGLRLAVPLSSVDEVIEIARDDIVSFKGNEIIQHRGSVLPLLRLHRALHLEEEDGGRPYLHGLIAQVGGAAWVLAVDRMIGEQEVVVKALGDSLVRTAGVVGAADLGDGILALVLDIPELVRSERERQVAASFEGRER